MISIILVLVLLLVLDVMYSAMNILAVAGIITVLAIKYKNLFKKAHFWYIGALILAGFAFYFYKEPYFALINGGIIGYGFLFTVMFVGVFPNKWELSRAIKRNRGVFSILGFIMISPHALTHVFGLLGWVNLFGIAAYVIMIPLTIISFRVIRKEIDPKDWFRIQKAAYLIYVILFVHLIMVSAWESKIIYAIFATLYINNKLIKEYKRK